jgi:hypothetical protein
MKLHLQLALGASAATMLVSGLALPASADTSTTFTMTGGGSLSVSDQTTAALSDGVHGDPVISGQLGEFTVTDSRGGIAGWTVSAASTAFAGTLGGASSTGVDYTGGVVDSTGTSTVADGTTTALGVTPVSVIGASGVSGDNTATWNPTLDVAMPASALADDYSGTVTTSVL